MPIIQNGQGLEIAVPPGQSIAIASLTGTYSATLLDGAGRGVLASASAGGATYGPYPAGATLLVKAGVDSCVAYDVGASPIASGQYPARFSTNDQGDISGLSDNDGGLILTTQNGLALVTIQGEQFAMLPVDANGDVIANIGQQTGLLGDLMALAGNPGQIGVATDMTALVLFNGTAGQAKVLKKLDNDTAIGPLSIAIGGNAATTGLAEKALALGYQAIAGQYGAVTLGGAIPKIQTVHATLGGTTTDASGTALSLDGVAENAVALKLPAGFHDVDVVFIARQGSNWARFHRRVMFRASSSALGVLANEISPILDVVSGLVGLSVNFSQFNAGLLYFNVVGLAATTIDWSAHVTIRSHGI